MKPTAAIPPEVVDRGMTTTSFQSVLDWALFYHREGLSVIPLSDGAVEGGGGAS
jgi:hypothetical protein